MRGDIRRSLVLTSSALVLLAAGDAAIGQTPLREIVVNPPKPAAKRAPAPRRAVRRPAAAPTQITQTPAAPPTGVTAIAAQTRAFNQARDNILPQTGTASHDIGREAIEALPQGAETPVEKVLLQVPGVHQDSAASGALHVRNEHGNVQYRINGILLPDGVAGMGQVLETGFIGNIALLTGALPAQYGLHTSGVVDITTASPALAPGGRVSVYGGSRRTFTPSFEYGNVLGKTEYFVTGRYLTNGTGIENPLPTLNAIHDVTQQVKFFGYASTVLDDTTRFTVMSGAAVTKFQIPNVVGQMPNFTAFGVSAFDSTLLNESQVERNYFNVLAVQKSVGNMDLQFSYFNRYSSVHFVPDSVGDLVFNGVASDVYRNSFVNGVQADAAFRINDAHTLRTGVTASGEKTQVTNSNLVEPLDFGDPVNFPFGNPIDAPFNVTDATSKFGWLLGTYVQDEWKLTNQLTVNLGLRFDQIYQFVDANQFSPRANVVYKPWDGTTFHAGHARTFTPPSQVIATPTHLALFTGTTQDPSFINQQDPATIKSDPVMPERANVYDVGVVQALFPGLEVGVDAYYKVAKDLLDDGQFGQALVLNGFNYEQGINKGVELKLVYKSGDFRAYGNLAWAQQMGKNIVSNQFLFAPDRLAFIQDNWIFTDHTQIWTGSAGMSYVINGTKVSADMIYGSGLRSGFANTDHVPAYVQVNTGISHEFKVPGWKPITVRFDVVNVFDTIYEIRDGTGIGVFAPQFGPRRGYFVGLSQKL